MKKQYSISVITSNEMRPFLFSNVSDYDFISHGECTFLRIIHHNGEQIKYFNADIIVEFNVKENPDELLL